MSEKQTIILMREGLAESLIADTFMLAVLSAAVYISRGDLFWSIVCGLMLALAVLFKAFIFTGRQPNFTNWGDAAAYCIKKAVANNEIIRGEIVREESK
jgi:Na+-transporting NADH:ubiquinone oxidoreductase subunit NqrB